MILTLLSSSVPLFCFPFLNTLIFTFIQALRTFTETLYEDIVCVNCSCVYNVNSPYGAEVWELAEDLNIIECVYLFSLKLF